MCGAISRPKAALKTRAECEEFVRETAQGALHPCGACKMGTDSMAVVDPQFRVRGMESLRVVDSSTMPFIPSGNLNGPIIMMANGPRISSREIAADEVPENLFA